MTQPSSPGELSPDLVPPLLPGAPPLPAKPGLPMFSAGFRVDRERAPEAIRELETAYGQLAEIKAAASRLGSVNPGSHDSVSIDAARMLERTATGGPGSLESAVDAAMAQVYGLIKGLRADLAAYEESDMTNGASFSGADRA